MSEIDNKDCVAELSLPQQNYIETIHELCGSHGHAHSKAIAESLKIKMPSVTVALRTLSSLGLINYEARKSITLTEKGLEVAEKLEKRHRVIKNFFIDVLGCSKKRADLFACKVEHVIDCELNDRMERFLTFADGNATLAKELEKFREQSCD